jgi:hypothetical protein
MEKSLSYKIKLFKDALENFQESLSIELADFSPPVIDTLKSGHV